MAYLEYHPPPARDGFVPTGLDPADPDCVKDMEFLPLNNVLLFGDQACDPWPRFNMSAYDEPWAVKHFQEQTHDFEFEQSAFFNIAAHQELNGSQRALLTECYAALEEEAIPPFGPYACQLDWVDGPRLPCPGFTESTAALDEYGVPSNMSIPGSYGPPSHTYRWFCCDCGFQFTGHHRRGNHSRHMRLCSVKDDHHAAPGRSPGTVWICCQCSDGPLCQEQDSDSCDHMRCNDCACRE